MFQQADENLRRASFTPFAARTQQYVKESLGGNVEKVGLRARKVRLGSLHIYRLNYRLTTLSWRSESML